MLRWREMNDGLPSPPGWQWEKRRGRPRRKKRRSQGEFTWQGMILVLLLKKSRFGGILRGAVDSRRNQELCRCNVYNRKFTLMDCNLA